MNSSTQARHPPLDPGLVYGVRRNALGAVSFSVPGAAAGAKEFLLSQDEMEHLGPALVSPHPCPSLGRWLLESVLDPFATAWWSLVDQRGGSFDVEASEGLVRLQSRGVIAGATAARFRHDARSLLNSIGMNADLLGMHARKDKLTAVADAAGRIRSSTESLSTLVADWTQSSREQTRLSAAAVVPLLLRRAGIEAECVTTDSEYPQGGDRVAAGFCEAVARLFAEWVRQWAPGDRLELHFQRGLIRLEATDSKVGPGGGYSLWYRSDAAEPELASVDPAEALRGMGLGFGAWQVSGSAGICAGMPAV